MILTCLIARTSFAVARVSQEHSIGFEVSKYKYQEFVDQDKKFMNINGERYGLSYEYFSRKSSLFWSYQGMLSFGDLIYDGQSQGEQIKNKI